ncbi:MAG TPA: rhomboid family intramembrane serine protease [Verrucomicrobiae bacterium]|nr:rhomboid family intramembrane serine protease [Verrucomicrobiae bacterium]
MLDDRDYMRQPVYRDRPRMPQMSFTIALLIVNAVVFLIECAVYGYPLQFPIDSYFALSVEGLEHGCVWQLLTYQFMHAGVLHILFNGWAIYVFGHAIEETIGGKKFLTLFLTGGVIGGLFQALAALLWPEYFGGPVVGASAGAFGLVAAYAMLFPERELMLLLFFIIPIRLTAKMLLIFSAVLALLGLVFPANHIANAAHLGGMLTGVIFIRQFVQGRWLPWKFPARRAVPRELVNVRAAKSGSWRSSTGKLDEEQTTDEFVSSEVDPILDKISAHGIQSLTAREREILEKARAKMTKR